MEDARNEVIEVETSVGANADAVYRAVADVTRMGEWSPECRGGRWVGGATTAVPGARFRGDNRNGVWRWSTSCTIVTADPGRELSWEVRFLGRPVALWRYRFAPDATGATGATTATTVTETMEDRRGLVFKVFGPLASGVGDRQAHNRRTMEVTLARLKSAVEDRADAI